MKCENYTSENRREFIRQASKIIHKWNDHLEIVSRPQVIKNSRQYLLLRTDISQKTVVGYGFYAVASVAKSVLIVKLNAEPDILTPIDVLT